jgi:TP901 family phage tail tape measure protein
MAAVGEAFIKIKADTSAFSAELKSGLTPGIDAASKQIGASMKEIGSQFQTAGREISKLSVPLLAVGVGATKVAMDFDSSMTRIQALVGLSRKEVDSMRDSVLQMSGTTAKGPRELGEALFFVTSAGLRGKDALEALEFSAKASAIGLGNTKVVADLVTSAMNAYTPEVLSAQKATDALTMAVRLGKLEPSQLASAMGQTLPVASAMGVSFNDVGAAFAAMSRTGTNASQAATQLRGIMTTILSPSSQASKALESVGLSAQGLQQTIRERGLLAALQDIVTAFDGNVTATEQVFGNVRALSGVMDMLGGNVAATEEIFREMNNAVGVTNEAFEIVSQTAEFKMQQALANLETAMVSLGSVILPIVSKIADVIADLALRFAELPEGLKVIIAAVGGFVAVLGPALWLTGSFIGALGNLLPIATKVVGAIKLMTAALLTSPWGIAAVAVAAFVGALFVFMGRASAARRRAEELRQEIASLAEQLRMGQSPTAIFSDRLRELFDNSERVQRAFRDSGVSIEEFTRNAALNNDAFRQQIEQLAHAYEKTFYGTISEHNGKLSTSAREMVNGFVGELTALADNLDSAKEVNIEFGRSVRTTADEVVEGMRFARLEAQAMSGAMIQAGPLIEAGFARQLMDLGLIASETGLTFEEMQEIFDDWADGIDKAMESAATSIFQFSEEAKTDINKFREELRENTLAFASWADNLEWVFQNVGADIGELFANLGPGFSVVLQDLRNMSADEIADFVAEIRSGMEQAARSPADAFREQAENNAIAIQQSTDLANKRLIERAEQMGNDFTSTTANTINAGAEDVKTAVDNMVTNATRVGEEGVAYHRALEIGKAIPGGVRAGIEATAGEVENVSVSALTRAFDGATRYLQVRSPSGLFRDRVGKPIMMGVAQGVKEAAPNAEREITAVLTRIIGTSQQTALQAFTAGQSAFRSAWQSGWSQVVSVAESAGRSIQSAFSSSANAMQNSSNSLLQSLRRGWQEYQRDAETVFRNVQRSVTEFATGMQTSFLQATNVVTQAWQRFGAELVRTMQQVLGDVKQRGSSGGQEIGQALVDGVIRGIQNRSGGLANALINAVRNAINAARAAAQVSSPSKLTEEELGKPLIQGVIKGIDEDGNLVKVALLSAVLNPMAEIGRESGNLVRITSRTGRQFVIQYTMAKRAVEDTNKAISDGKQAVEDFAANSASRMEQWVQKMGEGVRAFAADFVSVLYQLSDNAEHIFARIGNTMVNEIGNAVRNVESQIRGMIGAIDAGVDKVAGSPSGGGDRPPVSRPPASERPPSSGAPSTAPSKPTVGSIWDIGKAIDNILNPMPDNFFPGRGPGDVNIDPNLEWVPGWGAAEGPGIWIVKQPPTSAERGPAVQIMNATFVTPMDADAIAQKVLVAERARSLAS